MKAFGISPGSSAPAMDLLAAIKDGCGVFPQMACHPGSSDLEEVQSCYAASYASLLSLAFVRQAVTSMCACFQHGVVMAVTTCWFVCVYPGSEVQPIGACAVEPMMSAETAALLVSGLFFVSTSSISGTCGAVPLLL